MKGRSCQVHGGFTALIILVVGFSGYAAATGAPPLKPNEEVVKTADGCGMVIDKTSQAASYMRDAISKTAWGGACIDGLAMGEGVVGVARNSDGSQRPILGTFWYGRHFGTMLQHWDGGGTLTAFIWDGKRVAYTSLDETTPVWGAGMFRSSEVSDGDTRVAAQILMKKATILVHGLTTEKSERHECPKGLSAGCEELWARHAGPVIERIKAFIAEHEPKAAARMREIEPIVAKWKAQLGAEEVARREAAALQLTVDAAAVKKWEADCRTKEIAVGLDALDFDLPQSEREARKARGLTQLYEGECKGHPDAARALAEASELLRQSAQHRTEEAQQREQAAAYEREQAGDDISFSQLLGDVVSAAATGGNTSEERKQAVLDTLTDAAGEPVRLDPSLRDPSGYSSVCVRNQAKIDHLIVQGGLRHFHERSVFLQVNPPAIEMYRICADADGAARERMDYLVKAQQARQTECAGASAPSNCSEMSADSRAFVNFYLRETRKAIRDPDYSSELGPVGAGSSVPDPESACARELARIGDETQTRQARITDKGSVPFMELSLWSIKQAMDAIDRLCPQSESMRRERAGYELKRKEVLNACNQVSTSPCEPRLTGESR